MSEEEKHGVINYSGIWLTEQLFVWFEKKKKKVLHHKMWKYKILKLLTFELTCRLAAADSAYQGVKKEKKIAAFWKVSDCPF